MIEKQLKDLQNALDLASKSIDLTEKSINETLGQLPNNPLSNYSIKVKDLVKKAKAGKPIEKQVEIITKSLKKDLDNARNRKE
jgi:hypothetical protein